MLLSLVSTICVQNLVKIGPVVSESIRTNKYRAIYNYGGFYIIV